MSDFFVIDPNRAIDAEVRRIGERCIDDALAGMQGLENGIGDPHQEIHAIRKRCKELRGLLRLIRKPIKADCKRWVMSIRNATREFSTVRDAQVVFTTFVDLQQRFHLLDDVEISQIRDCLEKSAEQTLQDWLGNGSSRERAQSNFQQTRNKLLEAPLPNCREALEWGVRKTYCGARRAFKKTKRNPSDKHFHQWRRKIKYLWYQLRLLQGVDALAMNANIDALAKLADDLGRDHDMVVLTGILKQNSAIDENSKSLAVLNEHREALQESMRRHSLKLGEKLFEISASEWLEKLDN